MTKYEAVRVKLRELWDRTGPVLEPPAPEPDDGWDPFTHVGPTTGQPKREKIYLMDASAGETTYERKLRMLRQLKMTCYACTMCELGHKYVLKPGEVAERDPHVFSNMNPKRIMVVGQNPGWNELREGTPFVGAAGANFDLELARRGLSREEFYITNANKCYTMGNAKPTDVQRRRCEPFLAMEINLIKPLLVVALGASAFEALCEGVSFAGGLGVITRSVRYDVPVFGVFHPSPRNLEDGGREREFRRQMGLLCGLVVGLRGQKS